MSIIVPAGKNRKEWAPQSGPIVKTANTGTVEAQDELLDAARKVMATKTVCAGEGVCPGCPTCSKEECPEVAEIAKVEVAVEDPKEELDEAKADGVVTEKEEEDVEKKVEEKIEEAVESIEVILEDVKEAIGTQEEAHESYEGNEVSFEPEIEENDKTEFVADKAEESVEDEGEEKKGFTPFAGSEEEFCRYAKISPKNKAKLNNYWKNVLGFPADWVDLLTK